MRPFKDTPHFPSKSRPEITELTTAVRDISTLNQGINILNQQANFILSISRGNFCEQLRKLETTPLEKHEMADLRNYIIYLGTQKTYESYLTHYFKDYLHREIDNNNRHLHPFLGDLNTFAQELHETWQNPDENLNAIVMILDPQQKTLRRHSTQSLEEKIPQATRSCCLFPWRKEKPAPLARQARFTITEDEDRKNLVTP